jgi:molecular chaperone DnaK
MKAEDKTELEAKVEALKKLKDSTDTEAITKAMAELNEVAQKIGAAMYQQPGGETPTGAETPGEEKKDENIVEGEVEEKK